MTEWERHLGKAEEKFKSARILFEHGQYADAVSRGYYAMYHSAKAVLSFKDIHPRRHAGVISMFGLHFINEGYIEETYAKALSRGEEHRSDADYDIYYTATKEEAEGVIRDAEAFLERIKKAIKEIQVK
ncbi:MAG: HEPN domain-containing protein [Candidatus Hydrothermarchaeales archaeon]